jgi:hypothetical protein
LSLGIGLIFRPPPGEVCDGAERGGKGGEGGGAAAAAAAALPPEALLAPALAGGRLLEQLHNQVLPVQLGEREGGVAVVLEQVGPRAALHQDPHTLGLP